MNVAASVAEKSMQTVVESYKNMGFSIALTHTHNVEDANDVFQEVFLTYWRRQPAINSEEHRKAWLITTALNCSLKVTSSSWSRKVVPLLDAQHPAQQECSFHFRTDEEQALFDALSGLPAKYRTVLHLFYFEDMPVAQIAATLQIEAGTVKVQLSRGRALLREQLGTQAERIPFDD
ncbi:MAG: sigma-70 family RNA polymerase sigma factor [Coriobacteriales bacterium]|jgi:RNA polymerase sigma-70 factor (ECF subfamily)|nr:sigma-70 family RNA polymerase sigma factor [Coriobacteriales bacterium]